MFILEKLRGFEFFVFEPEPAWSSGYETCPTCAAVPETLVQFWVAPKPFHVKISVMPMLANTNSGVVEWKTQLRDIWLIEK